MRLKWRLIIASFKMYFRQREAIIWSFLLPLCIVILFSFVRFDGLGSIQVGVVDESGADGAGSATADFRQALGSVPVLKLSDGPQEKEMAELVKGERDLVVVIPRGFRLPGGGDSARTGLPVYVNQGRSQQSQVGVLLLQKVLDEMAFAGLSPAGRVVLSATPVAGRDLTYVDYLLPGVIAMSIMQLGIFGVAFGFVSLKKRGILRRLSATPVRPGDFIFAQVVMRLAVIMLQIVLMVGVGVLFLRLHFAGSLVSMFVVGLLGALVFLGAGFAIAGISRSEDQVAPLANLITLPMLLLGGVFFSRASLPGFLQQITGLLPLTHLADAMRAVAIDGMSLAGVWPQLLGLSVWGLVSCAVAVRLFRWE